MGVIYFQPMGLFCTEFHKNNPIWPIGMEALSRPGEQRGYGAYLREGSDLNSICPCRFFFWQNANVFQMIYKSVTPVTRVTLLA